MCLGCGGEGGEYEGEEEGDAKQKWCRNVEDGVCGMHRGGWCWYSWGMCTVYPSRCEGSGGGVGIETR